MCVPWGVLDGPSGAGTAGLGTAIARADAQTRKIDSSDNDGAGRSGPQSSAARTADNAEAGSPSSTSPDNAALGRSGPTATPGTSVRTATQSWPIECGADCVTTAPPEARSVLSADTVVATGVDALDVVAVPDAVPVPELPAPRECIPDTPMTSTSSSKARASTGIRGHTPSFGMTRTYPKCPYVASDGVPVPEAGVAPEPSARARQHGAGVSRYVGLAVIAGVRPGISR